MIELDREARLHAHHAAIIHALFAAAWGAGNNIASVMPDGMLLEAPEQSRLRVAAGEPYAFGLTILDDDQSNVANRLRT